MIYDDIWDILEISPTRDKKEIKKAYAKLTKIYHPEDAPEQFQTIQHAYKMALQYASEQTDSSLNQETNTALSSNKLKIQQVDTPIYTEDKQKKQMNVNMDKLYQMNDTLHVHQNKELFNEEFNINENDNNHSIEHKKQILQILDHTLPKRIDEEMLKNVFSDIYIKTYKNDPYFKDELEKIIKKRSYKSDPAFSERFARIAEKEGFKSLGRHIELSIRKDMKNMRYDKKALAIIIPCICTIILLFTVEFLTPENPNDKAYEKLQNDMNLINDIHVKNDYLSNMLFMNKCNVVVKDKKYAILEPDKSILIDNLDEFYFTQTPVFFVRSNDKFYQINTKKRVVYPTDYVNVTDVYVTIDHKPMDYEYLAYTKDGTNWILQDPLTNELREVEGEPDFDSPNVEIINDKAKFITVNKN